MNESTLKEGRHLIARSVAGPLNREDYSRLDALIKEYPELAEELRQQEEMDAALEAMALYDKLAARQDEAERSRKVIEFPASVQKRNSLWKWAAAAAVLVLLGVGLRQFRPGGAGREMVLVSAPDGSSTVPVLVWENAPDPARRYDVWILPEGADQKTTAPLLKGEGLRSPVSLASLSPAPGRSGRLERGRNYELLVCQAGHGRLAGTMVPFTVAADAKEPPATPAAAFLELQRLVQAGDKSAVDAFLQSLPPGWRDLPEMKALSGSLR